MFNSSHRGDNSDPDSDRMDDPFENMREQMDRQRDEFFNLNPRDWPSDSSNLRSGFFNKVGCQQISPLGNSGNKDITIKDKHFLVKLSFKVPSVNSKNCTVILTVH